MSSKFLSQIKLEHLINSAFPQACGGNPDCMCNTGTEEVLQDCINCIVAADVSLSVMISGLIKSTYLFFHQYSPSLPPLMYYSFIFISRISVHM